MGEPPCGKPCETASLVSKRLHILAEIGYHRIVNPSELLEFSADRTSPVHLERISYERNTLLSITGLTASVDEKTILHGIDLDRRRRRDPRPHGPQRRGQVHHGPRDHGRPGLHRERGHHHLRRSTTSPTSPPTSAPAQVCFLSFQAPVEIPAFRSPAFCARVSPAAPASR